jgi:hypothetical protein
MRSRSCERSLCSSSRALTARASVRVSCSRSSSAIVSASFSSSTTPAGVQAPSCRTGPRCRHRRTMTTKSRVPRIVPSSSQVSAGRRDRRRHGFGSISGYSIAVAEVAPDDRRLGVRSVLHRAMARRSSLPPRLRTMTPVTWSISSSPSRSGSRRPWGRSASSRRPRSGTNGREPRRPEPMTAKPPFQAKKRIFFTDL